MSLEQEEIWVHKDTQGGLGTKKRQHEHVARRQSSANKGERSEKKSNLSSP